MAGLVNGKWYNDHEGTDPKDAVTLQQLNDFQAKEFKPNTAWFFVENIDLHTGTTYLLGITENYAGKIFLPRSLFILITQSQGVTITSGLISFEYESNSGVWETIGTKDLTGLTSVNNYVSVLMGSNGLGKGVPAGKRLRLNITGKAKGIAASMKAKAYLAGVYF